MKIRLNLNIWAIILIFVTIISLVIRYSLMTDKFFIDSLKILAMEQTGSYIEGSFGVSARFFSWLNIFEIDDLFGWSVYISLIYFYINLWIVKDIKVINIAFFFFLLLSIFLWYLFSVGITKEVIQGLFYLSIYILCVNGEWIKNDIKIFIGSIVLLFSALVFREYYILTAFFSIVIGLILSNMRGGILKRYCSVMHIYFFSLISVMVFLYIASIVFPGGYERIVTLRNTHNMYLVGYTDTFIADVFANPTNSVAIYMGNYIVNFMRLLLPIELLFIGKFYYFPFLVYQFMFTWFYYKSLKNIKALSNASFLSLIFLTSFLIVSAMMEPDFGSWARHQSVCWMLGITLFYNGEVSK